MAHVPSYADGVEAEREAIVQHLHEVAKQFDELASERPMDLRALTLRMAADAIEAGEHLK